MFKRTQNRATSWLAPLLLLALAFVSSVAGGTVTALGGWS